MQTSGDNKPGWADDPAIQARIRYTLYVICALLVIADLIFDRHTYLPVEEIPAFYAFYGFAALIGLVELAKALRKLVGRDEDYYDRDDDSPAYGDDNNSTYGDDHITVYGNNDHTARGNDDHSADGGQ